jgi:hypothetical protein
MTARTNVPVDPNIGARAVWLAQVSAAASGLAATRFSEQPGLNLSPTPIGSISVDPARDRLLDSDRPLAPRSHIPSKSGLVMVALAVAFGLTAIFAVTHFAPEDNWSQSAIDRAFELISPPEPPLPAIRPIRVEPAIPRLIVHSSRGVAGEPAPLGLALQGPAEGAVVIITGLMPGMELSTGEAVGGGAWQMSARDLHYAWLAPSQGFVGSTDLVAELRLQNDVADRQVIHFEWISPTLSAPPHHEESAQSPLGREEIVPLQLFRAEVPQFHEVPQLQIDQQETTAIAPLVVQRPLDPEEITVVPLMSAETAFSRKEITSLLMLSHLKPGKNKSWTPRRSAERSSWRAPFAAVYARDNPDAPKGFWDWSR